MHDKALGILVLSQYLQDMNCMCHNSVTVTPVVATSWAQSALTPTEWVTGAGACFQVWLPMQLPKLDLSVQSVLKDEVILQSSNLYVKFPLGLLLRGTWSLLLNRKPVGISGLENGLCWNTSQVPKPRLSVLDHQLKTGYNIVAGGSLFQRMRGKSSCVCVCFSVFGADCVRWCMWLATSQWITDTNISWW